METPPNNAPPAPGETLLPGEYAKLTDKEVLVARIKERYQEGVGSFEENRRMHSEDLNFVYNSEAMGQWDPVVLEARKGKPCYTFNRVIGPVNMVVGDMRQTKPGIKVRPASEDASTDVAEIFAGLYREIEQSSRADTIYKTQYKFAVAGGFGAWRLMPQFAGDDTFDQVLRIIDIPNPQTVVWDAECNDPCCGDAMWGIVGDKLSLDKYKALFPNATPESSFAMSRDQYGWFTDKDIRVVEYMERVPFEKEIALMTDHTVIDYTAKEKAIEDHLEKVSANDPAIVRVALDKAGNKRIRKVLKWRVMWVKADGNQVLEGPIFYDWKRIPLIRVPGRYINIEGRKKLQSLIRHSKDAQRSYNSRCSDMIERSALTPKAPYLATEAMIKGYENEWAQANTASRPYLPFNIDPKAEAAGFGGAPQRAAPIDMPAGAMALAQQAAADIQATTGFFDPALGNADDMNRVSGKALVQHTRRSDLGSFEFIDGYGAALQLTVEMVIDMIPSTYDAERVIQIIGHDGVEKMVSINQQTDAGEIMNDLKQGAYNSTVTLGPSYQTARQETLAGLIDAAGTIPAIATVAPDLIARNIDSPDNEEMARRLRIPLIQQGIVQPTEAEKKNMPPPPQPNPMEIAELQKTQADASRAMSEASISNSKANAGSLHTEKMIYESAGKHLANLLMAQKLGNEQAAAQAEATAAAAEAAPDASPAPRQQ